jgi:magnesium transporter
MDEADRLHGTLTAQDLAALPEEANLGHAVCVQGLRVLPEVDQERLVSQALHRGVTAMPLVDATGRLVGVVGPRSLVQALRREHVKDLHRLAGITREPSQARRALWAPQLRRLRHRHRHRHCLTWLVVELLGSIVRDVLTLVVRSGGAPPKVL